MSTTSEATRPARGIVQFKLDLVGQYWAVTTILIALALADVRYAFEAVVMLNLIQVFHFIIREKSLTSFPVELRVSYLALLIISQAPFMIWILWWQLIGTAAMVIFRYCFLARCISLMPWRKKEAYSLDLFKRTFFSAPVEGSVLQGLPEKSGVCQ